MLVEEGSGGFILGEGSTDRVDVVPVDALLKWNYALASVMRWMSRWRLLWPSWRCCATGCWRGCWGCQCGCSSWGRGGRGSMWDIFF